MIFLCCQVLIVVQNRTADCVLQQSCPSDSGLTVFTTIQTPVRTTLQPLYPEYSHPVFIFTYSLHMSCEDGCRSYKCLTLLFTDGKERKTIYHTGVSILLHYKDKLASILSGFYLIGLERIFHNYEVENIYIFLKHI